VANQTPHILGKQTIIFGSNNQFRTFLNREAELPRLAVLQRFKDINRVMTETFLK
jgi:hypothetical protein